ncbi:phosphate ABC transporter permease subunit PstC [Nitratiruptor sp. YY09-18]|uniref:phosphate ABC transporter permease subunit PstC n=1 Tax=Nitratiruptor sp. YY09-18 TaxID=2724901 RepID=UPI0019165EE1|nr:phosphate ABC transporter permease subunit PstC [Nitratiruptor sp. YY09-18]BCD68507.1 phosphate transport system permease protein [Nitratiruptor sp. YY09-18]
MSKALDWLFKNLALISAISILIALIAIFAILFKEALPAIQAFGLKFLVNTKWAPNMDIFGGLPAIYGSIMSTAIAMLLATPIAIGVAIFLTEISPNILKGPIGTAIELLAAIPSIIYGMWGLFFFAPYVRDWFGGNGLGLLTAGFVLAIMILPFMAAITRDSMNTTPDVLKESAYALGATKWDVVKDVVIPFAKAGIIGSIILALGRAIGETMAVTFVMGNAHKIPKHLTDPATSIPVTLANEFTEADSDLYYSSLFYLALILFVISFVVIALAKFYFLRKVRAAK